MHSFLNVIRIPPGSISDGGTPTLCRAARS